MQVEVVSWNDTSKGVIYTMELTSSEVPRKDDVISFDGVTHLVHHVKWIYQKEGRLVMIDGLPPGTIYSTKLVGVTIYA